MEEINPAQKKQLEAWATRRDEILADISRLETEREAKLKSNIELTASNTDIETRINQGCGRLVQIEEQENARVDLVSHEIIALEKEKATLVAEIPALKQVIVSLIANKETLLSTIESLTLVHDRVFDRTAGLEAIVDHVKTVSEKNLTSLVNTFEIIKETSNEIIAMNRKNVSETMIVIEKLPRAILEYRRPQIPMKTVVSGRTPIVINAPKE